MFCVFDAISGDTSRTCKHCQVFACWPPPEGGDGPEDTYILKRDPQNGMGENGPRPAGRPGGPAGPAGARGFWPQNRGVSGGPFLGVQKYPFFFPLSCLGGIFLGYFWGGPKRGGFWGGFPGGRGGLLRNDFFGVILTRNLAPDLGEFWHRFWAQFWGIFARILGDFLGFRIRDPIFYNKIPIIWGLIYKILYNFICGGSKNKQFYYNMRMA